jgi:2-succinyl-5-enolpyruvyl-6-hydroxy-3-cyclohexene-1-carboxylate synthase
MTDTEHFTYDRSWAEIENMLDSAERRQNTHLAEMQTCPKSNRMYHMRNYKALEGVVKALRWVLGDKDVQHPLE